MVKIVVTSNHYGGDITGINISGVDEAYYLVISDEPFEPKWIKFKKYCKENFVIPHIVFITPLSTILKSRDCVEEFLTSYIFMTISDCELVGTYD